MHLDIKGNNMETRTSVKTIPIKAKEPNIAVELFLSLVKWFLIFIVINNLIWAGIYLYGGSSIELGQNDISSTYNNQSVTNG